MQPGDVLADRFEIESLAGAGGMGAVYRALDRQSRTIVAVKVLLGQARGEATRFEREARILASLEHPAIVKYIAHGAAPDGTLFLAIEWLDGEDLSDRLAREGLTLDDSLTLVRRIVSALESAHRHGVIHRDIKPSNLFLVGRDVTAAKVLDFGIARFDEASRRRTETGIAVGTPGYMSPEQARGERDLDGRADIFSVGCVLFECLTGRAPFAGEHILAVLAKILLEDAPRVSDLRSDVPAALDDLVARMLAKEPGERIRDAATLRAELEAIGSISPGAPLRTSGRPPEIGAGEQRLLGIVLAGPGGALSATQAATAPTVAGGGPVDDLDEIRHAAKAFGARIESLADGTIIAIIAGAGPATDQAAKAARCALAIRRILPDAPMAFALGRGVLSARWPVGEVIDRGVRLLRVSSALRKTGSAPAIRLDEATAGLLDAAFETVESHGAIELRDERRSNEAVRKLLGRPTAFIGRERELATLESLLNESIDDSRAHAVIVSASAGVGKSRLRFEFVQRVRRDAREATAVWIARGDPMSAGSSLGLLAIALRNAFEIRDGEELEARRAKIRARVAVCVGERERERVAVFLGELLGVSFEADDNAQLRAARQDPVLMGDQLMRAWQDFIAAECAAHPIVLVLDDLQWGDLPTVTFVNAALRQTRDAPFVVVAFTRPEGETLFPRLWEEHEPQVIRLGGLAKRASEKLVKAALADVDAEVLARIVERAGGNAFYLEELIRAIAEGKGSELPETVLAMAQARLDALDADSRRVLRAASVFGKSFWRGGVLRLLGGAERTQRLRDWIPSLIDGEILERRIDGRFPGDEEYVFRQALVRDAAYASLTDSDRVLGHQLAGAWLEQMGEHDAMVLAEHFDRGRLAERAAAWFHTAAVQALEGHDFAAALDRASRGAKSGASGTLRGLLALVRAEAHRWRGEFGEAEQLAIEAAAVLERGTTAWYRAVDEVLTASGRLGRFDQARAVASEMSSAPVADDASSARVTCLCSASRVLFHAGLYDEAHELLERVVPFASNRAIEPRALAEIQRLRGARARHVGDLSGDVEGYEQALVAFERAGDLRNTCNTRVSLGFAFVEVGALERGRDALERSLTEADRLGLQSVATRARQNLALVHAALGEFDRARGLAQRAIDESITQSNTRFEAWTRIYLATILHDIGDAAGSEREARLAENGLAASPPARAGALAALSRALTAQSRTSEALSTAAVAIQSLDEYGGIEEFESLVRLAEIEALRASGDLERARSAARTARTRLAARSAAIRDEALRSSFLDRVPENRRILAIASQLAPE